ncbi:hypothetical protein [Halorussus pelagicus]|uniref:hypothetical protein n=1 Tax=Halorussus pelagicus TaxID=2505977 RepID=UPI000FFC922E|nr:hypothetical protein [Halorussus pelagicus]
MDRRKFLRAGGVVAASSLAGCTGMLDESQSENDDTQPEKASERLSSANEKISANTDKLNDISQTFENDEELPNEFDAADVGSRIEKANLKLDEAEEYATEDQQSYIDSLRKVGEYQTALAKAFEDIVALNHKIDTMNTYFDSERYDQALEAIDEGRTLLSNIRTHVGDADNALTSVDADSFDESGKITYDSISADLSMIRDRLDLLESTLDGFEPMIEGMQDFLSAAETYENENYVEAADQFAEAQSHFQNSDETFTEIEDADTAVGSIESDIAELTCYTSALVDGTRLFEESARAADRGDTELAQQKASGAQDALDGCNFG